jgi:hypothetical protein
MGDFRSVGSGLSLKTMASKLFSSIKGSAVRLVNGLFRTQMDETKTDFNKRVKAGSYKLMDEFDKAREEINDGTKLRAWLKDNMKDNEYKGVQLQGHMFYFAYPEPLTKDELEYYDPFPLVICFNVAFKGTGNLVEYGLNLHYLPRKVRRLVVNDIFELFRKKYNGEMFSAEPRAFHEFSYRDLYSLIDKYHIDFAVRSYIPRLRKSTMHFNYQDWPKAILIETQGFKGITEKQLIQLYYKHVTEHKIKS